MGIIDKVRFLFFSFYSLSFSLLAFGAYNIQPQPWEVLQRRESDCVSYLLPSFEEQAPSIPLGETPYNQMLGQEETPRPVLPESFKESALQAVTALQKALNAPRARFEIWPSQNDQGELIWVFARYKTTAKEAWHWLNAEDPLLKNVSLSDNVKLPQWKHFKSSDSDANFERVFGSVDQQKSLYQKPLFSNGVLLDPTGKVISQWPHPETRIALKHALQQNQNALFAFIRVPRPPSWNQKQISFVLTPIKDRFRFTPAIAWRKPIAEKQKFPLKIQSEIRFSADFTSTYFNELVGIAGEEPVVFPLSGKAATFKRKNSFEPGHQLIDLVEYLEERYAQLNIETFRHVFQEHGETHINLIARIPGTLPGLYNKPALLMDHIDTALSEDVFAAHNLRISTHGADDNASGVAALLMAARTLKEQASKNPLAHDVWLVHLTGEEFPGDSMGARHFFSALMRKKTEISGAVLLDMISYRTHPSEQGRDSFQIHMGKNPRSIHLADLAFALSKKQAHLNALLRPKQDPKNYIYNTDGHILNYFGYPVILMNEHLNKLEYLDRPHYHQSTDRVDTISPEYGAAVSQIAIETVTEMASNKTYLEQEFEGRELIPIPIITQDTPFTCGPASLSSVLKHLGYSDEIAAEAVIAKKIGTTEENGSDPISLNQYALDVGLKSWISTETTRKDIQQALSQGILMLVGFQAWPVRRPYVWDWSQEWNEGHYAVIVGMDKSNIYFMDPTLKRITGKTTYGYIPLKEFFKRWHDEDVVGDKNWRHQGLAIFIQGQKPANKTQHPFKAYRIF